jgi:C4-dicarboxylate transporter DctQ subunit
MKVLRFFGRVEYAFLSACMLACTGLLFANVVLRYFFQAGIFWAEEALRYLMIWIAFIGAATCVRKGTHVSLDIVVNLLPAARRAGFSLFLDLAGTIVALFLFKYSLAFVIHARETHQVSSTMGGAPMYLIYSCLPVGLLLIGLSSATNFFKGLGSLRRTPISGPER